MTPKEKFSKRLRAANSVKSQATVVQSQTWDEERESIEAFLSLPPKKRQIVQDVILTFAKAVRKG